MLNSETYLAKISAFSPLWMREISQTIIVSFQNVVLTFVFLSSLTVNVFPTQARKRPSGLKEIHCK